MTKILLIAGVVLLFAYLYISQNDNDDNNERDIDSHKKQYGDIKCPNAKREKFTQEINPMNVQAPQKNPLQEYKPSQEYKQPVQEQQHTNQHEPEHIQNQQQIMDETETHDTNSIDESQLLSQIHSKEIDIKNSTVENTEYLNKFKSINQAGPEEYKQINYSGGNRNAKPGSDWHDQFVTSNELLGISNQFIPMDETNNMYASFSQKKSDRENVNLNGNARGKNAKDEDPEDIYDVDKLLPKEIKKDWFEVTPEPIRVKDRHLINTTRPVGINTIGTTLKNPSLDIRGAPSCPKYVVSPWMQSSIEPDTNIKPFCGM